jgi:hypothetical protein
MFSLSARLLDDLRPGADPHLAAIALHVAAPILRGVAEELEADTRGEPPATVTVALLGHHIKLHPEGADESSLAAAETAIVTTGITPRRRPWDAALMVLAGLSCFAVAAFVSTSGPALPAAAGAALIALAAWRLWRRRKAAESDARWVAAQVAELKELADGAVWALHAYAREAEGRAEQATADASDLTRLIRRGPRVA